MFELVVMNLKIPEENDRKRMILALANSGYKVKVVDSFVQVQYIEEEVGLMPERYRNDVKEKRGAPNFIP